MINVLSVLILLIVTVRRRTAERQSRERELLRGSVPIDHLPGNVQEDVVPFLVLVIQGAVRHEEEIFRGQTESVRGCGGDGKAYLRYGNAGSYSAFPSRPLAFNMI